VEILRRATEPRSDHEVGASAFHLKLYLRRAHAARRLRTIRRRLTPVCARTFRGPQRGWCVT
jgi:hypothetical protein